MKMPSHQDLTISHQDFAIFNPSWQVGVLGSQRLPKSLKHIDVESVNVEKTCEKLCLALNENLKYIQDNTTNSDQSQCVIKKSDMSFRDCSNIWFGTLKIYQQQVNTLFRLSQDLLTRSGNYDEKSLEACKRKSSLTSQKLIKRSRLAVTETCEETYSTTNYSKLLDDLEQLTRESTPEDTQNITNSITQYQIREITLREISAPTFIHSDELDEDSGFGEATHEEIAEFLNIIEDNDSLNEKRVTLKRKLPCVEKSPVKKSCVFKDYPGESMRNENITFDGHFIKTSPSKRSTSPIPSLHENKKNMESIYFSPDYVIFEADKIKKESMPDNKNISMDYEKPKRRKLIIDACIKIDMSYIMTAMKSPELYTKRIGKRSLKSLRSKRNILALELLTTFNRRSRNSSLCIKQKILLPRKQFKRDYLNLLREIFKNNYKEEWASQIYPKWISSGDEQLKRNKKQHINKFKDHNVITTIQLEADVCNLDNVLVTNLANDDISEEIPTLINKMDLLNTTPCDEWHPYGVMLKLLNLWRFNQTTKIAAYSLFKLANNQIARGLGFSSLLHLSKKRFVNLASYPGSIILENIEVGNNIKEKFCK